jgi:two-component system, OmpR family, sensor kinase
MKIFNSIKWRLQIWYGLILVIVLAGFGFTAYQLEYGQQVHSVDGELHRRFAVIANALHQPPHNPENFDRPPPGNFPDATPEENVRAQNFSLPPQADILFDTNNPNSFYFLIRGHNGKEIAHSANVPDRTLFKTGNYDNFIDTVATSPELRVNPGPPTPIVYGNLREIFQILPSNEEIIVGCSIAPELQELKITALKLLAVGGIILIFGLAGGWWFVSRALRPIENISTAAVKISAGDLSQRISIAETESELGQLAAVLNSTFARLESAFAQQKQFASDAAHELRTPVAVILTQTQTALNRERDAASYKETVEACQRAAQRMRKLIKSLLELARLDAGQEKLKRLPFDFSKTIEGCVELIRPIAEERRVKIIFELEPLEISGDSERLAQVVTNLLTNAIQYNRDGGEVRVKLKIKDGFAALKISDTGAGIPAEDLPHIFKRFYRGDKSRTGSGNAGLGLAISKAIVEAHGGTIEVASEENAGTAFTVRLPV